VGCLKTFTTITIARSRLFGSSSTYIEAAEYAEQFPNLGRRTSLRFLDIHHSFNEGLTTYLARSSTDESFKLKWMVVGEKSVDQFKVWQEHSTQIDCHYQKRDRLLSFRQPHEVGGELG